MDALQRALDNVKAGRDVRAGAIRGRTKMSKKEHADGQGPFPPTTAKNQGQCKAALKFFHSSFPG
jgi:hypothetical protein